MLIIGECLTLVFRNLQIFSKEAPSKLSALAMINSKPKPVENREFTIYVCSECHGVCTTKNDLKNHMIGVRTQKNLLFNIFSFPITDARFSDATTPQ